MVVYWNNNIIINKPYHAKPEQVDNAQETYIAML